MGEVGEAVIVGGDEAHARGREVAAEEFHDDAAVEVIEAGGGFVEEEDGGFLDEGAGDGGALLLSAGKGGGQAVGEGVEAEEGEVFFGAGAHLGAGQAGERADELEVAADGGEREEVELLENEAKGTALEGGVGRAAAGEDDGAGGGAEVAGDEFQEGAFTAAGEAFDEVQAGGEAGVEAVEHADGAVAEGEVGADDAGRNAGAPGGGIGADDGVGGRQGEGGRLRPEWARSEGERV